MRMRSAWLAAIVAVTAVVSVAVPTIAADKQSAQPSQEGTMVRLAPEDLRVEDMTDAELQQRLGEWEAGKRDDRDGYIVLNQIWFNHQAKRTTGNPEFQAVAKKRDELLKKHPEFNGLQDFRLSDKVQRDKAAQAKRTQLQQAAKAWTP